MRRNPYGIWDTLYGWFLIATVAFYALSLLACFIGAAATIWAGRP